MLRPSGARTAFYAKCAHCEKPFKTYPSRRKRRHAIFCSYPCFRTAYDAFMATYKDRFDKLDQLAA